MDLPKIIAFLKREWNRFNYLRATHEEKLRSEEDLSKGFFQEILEPNFFILLALAAAISTFGLLSNSAATIIGAMIIAPLMVPIISLAYSLVILDFRLVSYSLVRLTFGILLTVLIAFAATEIIGFKIPGSEILARTEPTLLDLGIAIAAGVAGAFAKIRRSVSDAIPGVAISVALVPPLCVVGIGLATRDVHLSEGAFVLFLTNLVGIIISADVIFLWQSYGSFQKAIGSLLVLMSSMIAISLPLNYSFQEMIAENRVRYALNEFSRNQSSEIKSLITSVDVELEGEHVLVLINVIQKPRQLNEVDSTARLQYVQNFISEKIGKPVHLKIRVFPVEIIDYEVAAPTPVQDER
ncbi:TIGR00341 family protein [Xenococcus sp. PCC 7305]|uniref:TIGR00341 family protein n=1 Tax=Xenococcus sp. PCC 7305 TaxID=102125 RepID=UPI0002ACF73C|nr:TIGR00341 family protein [Xenococcus sp. PCC 7305]ELS05249.1 TIGR00341 family protein [Xenococcus sp. PCC 7305]